MVNSFILLQAHRAEHTEIVRSPGYSQCDFHVEIVREICGFEELVESESRVPMHPYDVFF